MGVLARLCSHLREMTGLTIRATVSQLDCATDPHRLSHAGQALYILPGLRRPVPLGFGVVREPRYRIRYPSPSSQRLATTTAPQPPAVADRIELFFFVRTTNGVAPNPENRCRRNRIAPPSTGDFPQTFFVLKAQVRLENAVGVWQFAPTNITSRV